MSIKYLNLIISRSLLTAACDLVDCEVDEFKCYAFDYTNSNGCCLPKEAICDGFMDCVNGADENQCPLLSDAGKECEWYSDYLLSRTTWDYNCHLVVMNWCSGMNEFDV
jgi:hypothetical protein